MKALIAAAALAFSASSAFAMCADKMDSASKDMTTASTQTSQPATDTTTTGSVKIEKDG
ncbi:MAG: hypothetical protein K5872_15160 [Rhizobiaceae bacterium]|nr:hypothetical protein [Rhizobiaceae bacterium]MCV0407560.1 hypothetical protein [Rhizobiaceae bacterium]